MISSQEMKSDFAARFGHPANFVARAPGRVNLIGEHTDYSGGFVFPAAINCEIKMAARRNGTSKMRLHSGNYDQDFSFDTQKPLDAADAGAAKWPTYFVAVVDQFHKRGVDVPGLDILLKGDVPLGSGLSSSAAYEVCAATLLANAAKVNIPARDLALLAQAAEHSEFVGVKCGIMDQFASALGEKDHALMLDCYSLEHKSVPLDSSLCEIVIIDSMKKRGLVDSEYNQRRQQCEEGLRLMREIERTDYPTLRHIPADAIARNVKRLPTLVLKRLRHNASENQRVAEFATALRARDTEKLGRLLYQSHASLRDDFEVSCRELDAIVDIASKCYGVFGCRMTGAGFGGCAVALVAPAHVQAFRMKMSTDYESRMQKKPNIYVTTAAQGASVETV